MEKKQSLPTLTGWPLGRQEPSEADTEGDHGKVSDTGRNVLWKVKMSYSTSGSGILFTGEFVMGLLTGKWSYWLVFQEPAWKLCSSKCGILGASHGLPPEATCLSVPPWCHEGGLTQIPQWVDTFSSQIWLGLFGFFIPVFCGRVDDTWHTLYGLSGQSVFDLLIMVPPYL